MDYLKIMVVLFWALLAAPVWAQDADPSVVPTVDAVEEDAVLEAETSGEAVLVLPWGMTVFSIALLVTLGALVAVIVVLVLLRSREAEGEKNCKNALTRLSEARTAHAFMKTLLGNEHVTADLRSKVETISGKITMSEQLMLRVPFRGREWTAYFESLLVMIVNSNELRISLIDCIGNAQDGERDTPQKLKSLRDGIARVQNRLGDRLNAEARQSLHHARTALGAAEKLYHASAPKDWSKIQAEISIGTKALEQTPRDLLFGSTDATGDGSDVKPVNSVEKKGVFVEEWSRRFGAASDDEVPASDAGSRSVRPEREPDDYPST
jgi:hypothetical protein